MKTLLLHYADGTEDRREDVGADTDRKFYEATSVYTATHVTFTHAGGTEKLRLEYGMWWEVVDDEEGGE